MENDDRSNWCRVAAIEQSTMTGASTEELRSCALAVWAAVEGLRIIQQYRGEMREVTYTDGRPPSFVIFLPEHALTCRTRVDDLKHYVAAFKAGWIAGRAYGMTLKKERRPRSNKKAGT